MPPETTKYVFFTRGLVLANEFGLIGTNRKWIGTLHLVAVYSTALTSDEVNQNLKAGPPIGDIVVPLPTLQVRRNADQVEIAWPFANVGYQLQQTGSLAPAMQWNPVAEPVRIEGDMIKVAVPINAATRFYRLVK